MIPFVARNMFRIQETILGRQSFRILKELNSSQWWPEEKIEKLRTERLKILLHTAHMNSPYWRKLMDSKGILPEEINKLDDIKRFPLLEKNDLRKNREKMVSRIPGRRLQLVRTSGSTNEALEFYTTSVREAHINAARMRGHEWAGIKKGEREMYYWGSPVELSKQDRIKKIRDFFINDGLTNGFELNLGRVKNYYRYWKAWKPECIFGYPSTFVLTIHMCSTLGLDLRELKKNGLRVVVTTSEMLSDIDRTIIENAFGVKVHDSYGLREGGLIGYECGHGTMHTMDEQLYLETIDPKTLEPVSGEGELVVTNLTGLAFPIIRYRTGDIVTLSDKKCACGRSLSSIEISGGRAVDFIVTEKGKWVVGYSFIYIARSVQGIIKFQVVQEKIGEIKVFIVIDDNFPKNGKELVEKGVKQRLKSSDKILIKIVEDIKPAPSGKYRPVISRVAENMIRERD